MKKLKQAAIALFSLMILMPLAGFRFGEGIRSEIDNRMLQENPFGSEERAKVKSMPKAIAKFVNDRLGFRDEMILANMVLNDKIFGEMVHPTYRYGKSSYVFYREMATPVYGNYHELFADMVRRLQDYCEIRGIPFLFVFEPCKSRIMSEYLPAGVHYDSSWVDSFFCALDKRGVHYVDNSAVLRQKITEGKCVFNRQFDAGHWNEIGMYYGTNAILEELHKSFRGICSNNIEEFETSKALKSFLPVSKFPIHEYVPEIKIPLENIEDITSVYNSELERHKQFQNFGYFRNRVHLGGTPRVLFFQGSYLNKAMKYLKYSLGEYIHVHDYQNVLEFPYYFNIFQPECVVFEVAEDTIKDSYFDEKKIKNMQLNPRLQLIMEDTLHIEKYKLNPDNVSVQQSKALTKIIWNHAPNDIEFAWCLLDGEYDMRPHEGGGYEVTVKNEVWQEAQANLKFVVMKKEILYIYA